jgi:hypothetical protein
MHDELFKRPAVVARYRTGPHVESRERFLKQARADGYPRSALERIAWALLVVAEAIQHRGCISSMELKHTISKRIRLRSSARPPSAHTAAVFLRYGEAWLRSIGAHREGRAHRLLLMLDEFPALGRLDFFESALAFMAGYGLASFLIAQSLNQIKHYQHPIVAPLLT